MEEKRMKRKKVLQGKVVSTKMQKTIVVLVENRRLHPLYQKYVTTTKKFKAHDAKSEVQEGDVVTIIESRPVSKQKSWKLLKIVEKVR